MREVNGVVVAFHAPEQLEKCLRGLQGSIALTVVDNSGSTAVRVVAASCGAGYIDSGANLGFAGGVNIALRALAAEPPGDVLLLNPDSVLAPRDLRMLSAHLHDRTNERVAAVSPRLIGERGSDQRVAWPFPSPVRAWLEALGLGRLPSRRSFVVGAVLLLRWEAIQEVGMFDERFFLYAEEADWQRRAAALNWSSDLCAGAVAHHVGGATSDDPRRREALFHAAQETYIRKWFGASGWPLYRTAACAGALGRALVLPGQRRTDAARRARLYLHGPRRVVAGAPS